MRTFAIFLLLLIIRAGSIYATPQLAMLTGNKCMGCHVSPQGGNVRNALGFYAIKDFSILKPEDAGLGDFHSRFGQTNTYLNEHLTFGFDVRYQTAMLGGPVYPQRRFFWMQASPYLVINPFKWLTIGGNYNFVQPLYPAQKSWTGYVIAQPNLLYPYIRAGYIQPAIGLRYDDHTVLVRQVAGAARALPLIPIDYAEYGAEIGYEGIKWLSLTGGVYGSRSMAEILINDLNQQVVPIVDSSGISTAIKVSVLPRFEDNKINTNIGGSFLVNKDFYVADAFIQAGFTDNISFIGEYMHANKKDLLTLNNFIFEFTYQLINGLLLDARFERGSTNTRSYNDNHTDIIENTYNTNQYVFGAQIFPLPFIEIRPEYRIYDREWVPRVFSQWVAQAHIFF